jgi:arylsulfatase A-like enzyme
MESRTPRAFRAFAVLVPVVSMAAALLSCSSPGRSERRPNIVVIVIDTLRADHLPSYGYGLNTAPFLSSLAEDGIVLDRAYSTSSWTAPATASLFTSLYPQQHGVVTGRAVTYQMRDKLETKITLNRIPAELETLPEAMKRAGYRTYGVSDNFNVCEQMGFQDGFDVFRSDKQQYRGGDHVNDVVRGWREELAGGEPYFLYVHYMDPHVPYNARRPWYRSPASIPGAQRPPHLAEPARAEAVARYDSEIGFVDQKIRELYELFGWDKDTLLVVTSDHGEEFWDHGFDRHDKTLYDEVLRVPFMVHDATGGMKPARIDDNVSLIDLLPTLAEYAGLPPEPRHQGRSLLPLMKGGTPGDLAGRRLYAHLERHFFKPWGAHNTLLGDGHEHYIARAAMHEEWKLVVDSRELSQLFDRQRDPGESRNVYQENFRIAGALSRELEEFTSTATVYRSESFEEELSPEEIERLRSLGYVN